MVLAVTSALLAATQAIAPAATGAAAASAAAGVAGTGFGAIGTVASNVAGQALLQAAPAAGAGITAGKIATGVSALSAVEGVRQQHLGIEHQRLQARKSENLSKFESKRQRKEQVRSMLIRQAEVKQAGSTSGVGGGSSESAALGSIGSTAASNQSFLSSSQRGANQIASSAQGAQNAMARAGVAGSVGKAAQFGAQNEVPLRSLYKNMFRL